MKTLAGLVVSGRWQAVAIAAASGILAFMLPPFSSVLNYLAGAVIALVTLQIGVLPGLQVLLLAGLVTVVFFQLLGVQAAVVLATVTLLWLPCWMLAMVLRGTRELASALKAAALFGISLLVMVYALFGDPAVWWVERLTDLMPILANAGFQVPAEVDAEVLRGLAGLMTGLMMASVVFGVICGLLLARWWQSVIVRPGAFADEFQALRHGVFAGTGTLLVMLLAALTEGVLSEFFAQAALVLLVIYLFSGLAVVHWLIRKTGRSIGWLVAMYALFVIMGPQLMLVLASVGLMDTWVDFRGRVERGAGK
jgi:hypothetical protein